MDARFFSAPEEESSRRADELRALRDRLEREYHERVIALQQDHAAEMRRRAFEQQRYPVLAVENFEAALGA
ncbi:MAG: hypothetical protein AAGI70_07800 [Pseudomonadota bacterium]